MRVRHILAGVEYGFVLLTQLFDVGVFLLGELLDIFLEDDRHGE
jgi:hypothetical protein